MGQHLVREVCNLTYVYTLYNILYLVNCSSLTNPNNGIINCSLGDDGVPFYEDICNFTCNTGYELTSSDTRTCQSDGSWSGSESMCRRGNHLIVLHSFMHKYNLRI